MISAFPKFIIEQCEDGLVIYIGKVNFHRQLRGNEKSIVKGGGWWYKDGDSFVLHGESEEFGEAKLEDINDCIMNDKVFTNYTRNRNLSETNFFCYKDVYGEIIKLPINHV